MLNQIVLVGRLTSDPQINEVNGIKQCNIIIAVPRSYKNADGIYETDFIPCKLINGISEQAVEYCKKGDMVGIRGRIQTTAEEDKTPVISIIVERLTFLSNRKDSEEV